MDDALTLVVPTRNAGPMFREAMASALPQLRPDDEVCVFDNQDRPGVDMGGLPAPCEVTVTTPPRSVSGAQSWSTVLSLGSRPWVLWLHDDDVLRPGAVAALRRAVDAADVIAWGSDVSFRDEPPDWRAQPPLALRERRAAGEAMAHYLFSAVHACSGTLFRRDALAAALPIPEGFGFAADRRLFQRVAAQGSAAVLSGPTVGYRRHAGSATALESSRGRWRASLVRQRSEAAGLLLERGVGASTVASVAATYPRRVVLDALRSLVRGRSALAAPLAAELERRAPRVARGAAWTRVRAGVRWGPLVLDLLGPLEWVGRASEGDGG